MLSVLTKAPRCRAGSRSRGSESPQRFRSAGRDRCRRLLRELERILAARVGDAVLTFFLVLESSPGLGDFGTCRRIGAHALHGSISHRHTPAVFVLYDEISSVRRNDSVFPC